MEILKINNLSKGFGEKSVLKGLSFSVPEHSVFGFVGKNGAGKTTTMKAVLGLIEPDDGEIFVCGQKVKYGQTKTNKFIGFLPDVPEFYSYMTASEYLTFCGEIFGMDRNEIDSRKDKLLKLVGLDKEKHRIKGFSRGMKQRLGIAQALLSKPKLLICDEPTSALDPAGRKEILDILYAARSETTVFFSTHILSDIERICTDVAVLNDGNIALSGRIEEIKNIHSQKKFTVELSSEADLKTLQNKFCDAEISNNKLTFSGGEEKIFSVMTFLTQNKILPEKIERMEPSLETLFLEVTK